MWALLKCLFFLLIVHPLVLVVIGLRIRHKERLPKQGPAILVANHNSHLDTLVLMSLFPFYRLPQIRPIAAADYFFANPWLAWFSRHVIGIIPLERFLDASHKRHPFFPCYAGLEQGNILILYPEGTRGEPEKRQAFKAGIAHLAKRFPAVPIYPIFLHGSGKSLPRGNYLLVPFFCDVFIGSPVYWTGRKKQFLQRLETEMSALADAEIFPEWL